MISRKNQKIIGYSACVAILIYSIEVIILNRYKADYSLINCFINIYFCYISCMYLLDLVENPKEVSLNRQPEFIYAMISLFYYSVSLLFWIVFYRFTGKDARDIVELMTKIFLISNLIFYTGILVVILLEARINSQMNESRYA